MPDEDEGVDPREAREEEAMSEGQVYVRTERDAQAPADSVQPAPAPDPAQPDATP